MTAPTHLIDNKTALRASLKKEDESLASRLTDSAVEPLADRVAAPVAVEVDQSARAIGQTNSDARGGQPPAGAKAPGNGLAPNGKETEKVGKKIDKKVLRAQSRNADKTPKDVKRKPEKMVRCALELPKSENAAIDTLRSDLAKAAGRKTSKSEIVRAAVHLFAEQNASAKKELLAAVATVAPPVKGRKKG